METSEHGVLCAMYVLPKTTPCTSFPKRVQNVPSEAATTTSSPGLPACMHGQHMEQVAASASDLRQ